MDAWLQYQSHGLWGLWKAYFDEQASSFEVVVSYDGLQQAVSVQGQSASLVSRSDLPEVFTWVSGNGLEVSLRSDKPVSESAAALWQVFFNLERVGVDLRPTFFPFMPAGSGLSRSLNEMLLSQPALVLLNGQPGAGKRFLLQSLCLLRAGWLPDLDNRPVSSIDHAGKTIWVVPEVALLEIDEQQNLWKRARAGDSLWVASVYDIGMLRDKKIVYAALATMLEPARILLPALAKRDANEVQALSQFWQSFYGGRVGATAANLAFLKRQVLGGAGLSVESILEEGRGLRGVVAEFEKEAILKAYAKVGRSQHKISRLLKVSRGSLQHKLRKYQLESYTSSDADNDA